MNFRGYTLEEVAQMRQILQTKATRLRDLRESLVVTQGIDDPNIPKRKRLSKVTRYYFGKVEDAKLLLRRAKVKSVLDEPRKDSKRKRAMVSRLNTPGKWLRRYNELLKPHDLPKVLIGNAVLEELPFQLLYDVHYDHDRLQVFVLKGTECVHPKCQKTATRLIKTLDNSGLVHLDVFTDDLQHMNVDHIIPLSKEGPDTIENKQPMCARHNSIKSNKLVPY